VDISGYTDRGCRTRSTTADLLRVRAFAVRVSSTDAIDRQLELGGPARTRPGNSPLHAPGRYGRERSSVSRDSMPRPILDDSADTGPHIPQANHGNTDRVGRLMSCAPASTGNAPHCLAQEQEIDVGSAGCVLREKLNFRAPLAEP